MPLSVLISIYSATTAQDLTACLDSLAAQTLPADEILIVEDGPLSEDTAKYLQQAKLLLPIRVLSYPKNRGLGLALRDGLLECSYELVARVDSDDRSLSDRFLKQVTFLNANPNISVVGGGLREWFNRAKRPICKVRNGPIDPRHIGNRARRRNPLNHPTVMFRRSAVLSCGNYQPCELFEDYFLWARMVQTGYQIINLADVLVETDVDLNYFSRRGGFDYLGKEVAFAQKLRQIGFFSRADLVLFLIGRIPVRLIPLHLRPIFYRLFLRNSPM